MFWGFLPIAPRSFFFLWLRLLVVIRFSWMMQFEKLLYSSYYPFFVIIKEEPLSQKKNLEKWIMFYLTVTNQFSLHPPPSHPHPHNARVLFLIKITLFQLPEIHSQWLTIYSQSPKQTLRATNPISWAENKRLEP